MDEKDLQAIDNLLKKNLKIELRSELEPIKEKLDSNTASVMRIEQKINAALELRQDVAEVRTQVKDHEERINQLETN
ncbi:MAG: hypothetical protein Q8P13_01885 [bacterium]|nr:hypothetical protein [bacterium]